MMNKQTNDLTPLQLAWCRDRMPAFAKANDDVERMKAEVARNHERLTSTEPENLGAFSQGMKGT